MTQHDQGELERFYQAVLKNHRPKVDAALAADAGLLDACDAKVRPKLLHAAAVYAQTDLVERFVDAGFRLDGQDSSSLHRAAAQGNSRILGALLRAGADVHAKQDGITPLMKASQSAWNLSPLHFECVRLLVEAGAQPGSYDEARCLLEIASRCDNWPVMAYLIEHGAPFDAVRDGRTVCDVALDTRNYECAYHLIRRGAPCKPGGSWFAGLLQALERERDQLIVHVSTQISGDKFMFDAKVKHVLTVPEFQNEFRARIRVCDPVHLDGYETIWDGLFAEDVAARRMREVALKSDPVAVARLDSTRGIL